MPRTITFDPDALEETDAIYLIDLLNDILQQDGIMEALAMAAQDIADQDFAWADEIYPQTTEIWNDHTRHQANAKRDAHLRRFGFMKGE